MFNIQQYSFRARIPLLINKVHHEPVAATYENTSCDGNNTNNDSKIKLVNNSPEVFVDLYCGIGYFTLPVALKCSNNEVAEIWACDWNSQSIKV